MSDTTTRNLAREVAMALVSIGKLKYLLPHADYENDLNACARDLTREGYKFHAEQLADNLWTGYYTEDEKPFARLIGWNRSDKLAVAWCESLLALCKHVDGQLSKGEQS